MKSISNNTELKRSYIFTNLLTKYTNKSAYHNNCKKLICYISNEEEYQVSLDQQKITYRDQEIYHQMKEYMKRLYGLQQFGNKIEALSQYYKHQKHHITYNCFGIQETMTQYNWSIKRMIRKALLPNQTSLSNFSQVSLKNRQPISHQNSQICKGILDTPKSSIILDQICQTIGSALRNFKPKYYYQGILQPKNEIEKFKRFIETHKIENTEYLTQKSTHRFNKSKKNCLNKLQCSKSKRNCQQHLDQKQNICLNNVKSNKNIANFKINRQNSKLRPSARKNNTTKSNKCARNNSKPISFSKTTVCNQTISREQAINPFNPVIQNIRRCSPTKNQMIRTQSNVWKQREQSLAMTEHHPVDKCYKETKNLKNKKIKRPSSLRRINLNTQKKQNSCAQHNKIMKKRSLRKIEHSNKSSKYQKQNNLRIGNIISKSLKQGNRVKSSSKIKLPSLKQKLVQNKPNLINQIMPKNDQIQIMLRKKLNLRI